MENLPIDIIENILHRLPTESSLLSKRVCKTWRNIIGDNVTVLLFAYANVNNLSAESGAQVQLYCGDEFDEDHDQDHPNETLTKLDRIKYRWQAKKWYYYHHMVGSCNGLVCLRSYNQVTKDCNCVGICNPVTGEFVFLPGPSEPYEWQELGFGYLAATNENKVVRCSYLNNASQGLVEVYTLGSQSGWRRKENVSYQFCSSGLFANGAIHWIGESIPGTKRVYKIVAYDLADEKFKDVTPLPIHLQITFPNKLELMRGNLCVIQYDAGCDEILVWELRKRNANIRKLRPRLTRYYNHNWSWSKEFSIAVNCTGKHKYIPFGITESSDVLLWYKQKSLYLYCYDTNTPTFIKLRNDDGKGLSCLQAILHMNTLVSLKDIGECSGNNATPDNGESSGSNISILRRSKRRKCQ